MWINSVSFRYETTNVSIILHQYEWSIKPGHCLPYFEGVSKQAESNSFSVYILFVPEFQIIEK